MCLMIAIQDTAVAPVRALGTKTLHKAGEPFVQPGQGLNQGGDTVFLCAPLDLYVSGAVLVCLWILRLSKAAIPFIGTNCLVRPRH
jgi:hypothetical protein